MTTTLLNNRYQVIEVLGAGGFGETFLAEDTYMPSRRRCAIKQLKPIAANDPQTYKLIRERFEREAATLEYLGKSNDQIPELYAYFPEKGQFYLVQEWIHGQTLTQIIAAKGLLNESTVREILLHLLSVLDYVHSKGIIHRDIKPDNIILRSSESPSDTLRERKPILIDFGAVKETIRSVVGTPGYPTQSLVMGTPGYMPSEQAVGRPVYATDIYSLGLTAIYLLTGKRPQELETNQQTGEILWQQYAPNVSPSFAIILNQAIKPHPGDRYSTASKMLHALQSVSSVTPQSAPTAATIPLNPVAQKQTQTPPTQIRHNGNWRKPAWIVGGLIAGSLFGAVAIANLTRQPEPEASIATSPEPETTEKASSATPTPSPETSVSTDEPADTPIASQPSSAPIIRTSPQQPVNPAPVAPRIAATTQPETEQAPTSSDDKSEIPVPIVPDETPAASVTQPQTEQPSVPSPDVSPPPKKSKKPPKEAIAITSSQSVPAFPTGTARSSVEATLGKPVRDSRGAWGHTRAVTYTLVPNQIDLGYLFDRNSGELRQTEASFAQSVDPQVMQTTIEGMLGGQATEEIKQGLQQIQQRQKDNFSFTQGGLKGQIVRQECDLIYISIWDANLHDFVSVSQNRQC